MPGTEHVYAATGQTLFICFPGVFYVLFLYPHCLFHGLLPLTWTFNHMQPLASVSGFFPSKPSPMSDLTPHFFRRSSSDPIACIGVFSSFCWEAGKVQNPHAGLQCSLCSGSTTFSPAGHIVPCQPHWKVYLSLSPSQTTPLSCLCVCFSCPLESSWCPLHWMSHPRHFL